MVLLGVNLNIIKVLKLEWKTTGYIRNINRIKHLYSRSVSIEYETRFQTLSILNLSAKHIVNHVAIVTQVTFLFFFSHKIAQEKSH